jgi:hypothetical protein
MADEIPRLHRFLDWFLAPRQLNLGPRFSSSFLSVWMAFYGHPRCHLRPHRSFKNSQIRRRARRQGNRHRRANFRLYGAGGECNGHPLFVSMIQLERERLHRLSIERKEIVDGKIRVTVPGTWTKMPELNKQATLQVGDKSKQMYLIVITDAKAAVGDLTLEKHHQLTRDRMLRNMKNASATQPVPLTIEGHPAMQDELSGTENDTKVVFLRTTVDDGDHFQQILAWTLKSRWEKQNKLLREIAGSFRSGE